MPTSLLHAIVGTTLLFVLLCWAWNPNVAPSTPDARIDIQDPNQDITVYIQSPREFGWSRRIDRYELHLRWIETESPIVLRTVTLRPSKRRRTFGELFERTDFLCPSLRVGLGKPHTLPAGRYEIGLRAHNGATWGKWKRKEVRLDRPLSVQPKEDRVSICVRADGVEEGWM